jgi:hypothetical protein
VRRGDGIRTTGVLLPLPVALVLALTGCTGDAGGTPTAAAPSHSTTAPATTQPATTAISTPTSTSTSTSVSVPSSSAPTVAARTDPAAPKGQCADSALAVSVQADPEGGAAGHTDSFVVFRNSGRTPCVLKGSPGVSVVGGGDGTQLGHPAARIRGAGTPTVGLRPGAYAVAELVYSVVDRNGGIYADGHGKDPTCEAAHGEGYRVYPPHGFRAFFSRADVYACTTDIDWISIRPVRTKVTGFTPRP